MTGKLPGDRPYTLMGALTRSKQPELDGYTELCEIATDGETEDGINIQDMHAQVAEKTEQSPAVPIVHDDSGRLCKTGRLSSVLVVSTANKGGVGKTTTAIHIATALARAGIPTVLIDLDLSAPDIATYYKIKDVPGIERLRNQSLVPLQVDRLLITVNNDLQVLPGPMDKTLPHFNDGELSAILNYLKQRFPVVVCDTSPEFWTKRWLNEVFEATGASPWPWWTNLLSLKRRRRNMLLRFS